MKATIVTSQFTVMVDGYQIDICYNFNCNKLEGYVDGECVMDANFNPARVVLSYSNILHMAVELLKVHHLKINRNGI